VPERSTPLLVLTMGRARCGEASIRGVGTGRGEKEHAVYFTLTRDASHDM
jgi:hypothetical protein